MNIYLPEIETNHAPYPSEAVASFLPLHPSDGLTESVQVISISLSDIAEPKLLTGKYMPPVPPTVTFQSEEDFTATAQATRELGGRVGLAHIFEDRQRPENKNKPTEVDWVTASEHALRDYRAGRYNPLKLYGQVAVAATGVWSEGADEHRAYRNNEEREYRLSPELAKKMFELHLAATIKSKASLKPVVDMDAELRALTESGLAPTHTSENA
jgi:hypothetical protein